MRGIPEKKCAASSFKNHVYNRHNANNVPQAIMGLTQAKPNGLWK